MLPQEIVCSYEKVQIYVLNKKSTFLSLSSVTVSKISDLSSYTEGVHTFLVQFQGHLIDVENIKIIFLNIQSDLVLGTTDVQRDFHDRWAFDKIFRIYIPLP